MLGSKPLASLSSGLLARKGQARPAMRRQDGLGLSLEDLGWNDMGAQPPARPSVLVEREALEGLVAPAPAAELKPEAIRRPDGPPATLASVPASAIPDAPLPATGGVAELQPAPSSTPLADPAPIATKPVSAATAARIGRETRRKTGRAGKAAFTLRLDTDRHLRLRLASAVTNQSSQALVATALDAFLKTLPEVETLVARLSDGETR